MLNCNHNRKIQSCKECYENQLSVHQYSANLLQENINQFESKHIKHNPILDRYLKDCKRFNTYEIQKLEKLKEQKLNRLREIQDMKIAISHKVYIYDEQIKQQQMRIQIDHLQSKEKLEVDKHQQLILKIQQAKRMIKEKQEQKLQELINILSESKKKFYYAEQVIKNQQDFLLLSICDSHGFSTELKFQLTLKSSNNISQIEIKSFVLTIFLFIQQLSTIFELVLPYKIDFDTINGLKIWKNSIDLNLECLNYLFIDYVYLMRKLDIHVYKDIFNNCKFDLLYLIKQISKNYNLQLWNNNLVYELQKVNYTEEQEIQQYEINKYSQFSCYHLVNKKFQNDDEDDDFLVID